jgi:hypothetical protein
MGLPSRRATQYVVVLGQSDCWDLLILPQVALTQDIDYATVLSMLREARSKGLKAPVILMGTTRRLVAPFASDPV